MGLKPGLLRGRPLHNCCTTPAPPFVNVFGIGGHHALGRVCLNFPKTLSITSHLNIDHLILFFNISHLNIHQIKLYLSIQIFIISLNLKKQSTVLMMRQWQIAWWCVWPTFWGLEAHLCPSWMFLSQLLWGVLEFKNRYGRFNIIMTKI